MDNGTPTPDNGQPAKIWAGKRLRFFDPKDHSYTPFSAEVMNQFVAVVNAFLNLKVVRKPAENLHATSSEEKLKSGSKVIITDTNVIIELSDAPAEPSDSTGNGSIIQMRVDSQNENEAYLTAVPCTVASDGTITDTGAGVLVAKPWGVRELPDADVYRYQHILPPYIPNVTIIYVTQPTGGTGVFVDGVELVYLDTATRMWGYTKDVCIDGEQKEQDFMAGAPY